MRSNCTLVGFHGENSGSNETQNVSAVVTKIEGIDINQCIITNGRGTNKTNAGDPHFCLVSLTQSDDRYALSCNLTLWLAYVMYLRHRHVLHFSHYTDDSISIT